MCRRGLRILWWPVLALLATAQAAAQPSGEEVFPGSTWEDSAAPHQKAECRNALADVRRHLQTLDTTSLMAVKQGRVLFSYGTVAKTSIVFSVRKSILAMMFGRYVGNGTIDVDSTLAEVGIDDIGGLLPTERQATLRHLLTSRSGVFHAASNGGDDGAFAPPRGSQAPGSYFIYNNWDFNALGTAFEKLTRQSIYQAFAGDLAAQLQLEDFDLSVHRRRGDATHSEHMPYHFFLSTRDMARLGHLMLQEGRWNGEQLVPSNWVRTITTKVTPSMEMHPPHAARRRFGYGYLWWLPEVPTTSPLSGSYMAWGVHGQYILVMPQRRMVIAHKRLVPDAGRWDVSWVQPADFLRVASMLATSPCE